MQHTHDGLLGRFELGAFHLITSGGQLALIQLGGNPPLRYGLVERGLRLAQRRFLLILLLARAAGVETDYGVTGMNRTAGRRQPNDTKIGTLRGA